MQASVLPRTDARPLIEPFSLRCSSLCYSGPSLFCHCPAYQDPPPTLHFWDPPLLPTVRDSRRLITPPLHPPSRALYHILSGPSPLSLTDRPRVCPSNPHSLSMLACIRQYTVRPDTFTSPARSPDRPPFLPRLDCPGFSYYGPVVTGDNPSHLLL